VEHGLSQKAVEIGRVFGGSQNSLEWLIAGLHDFLEGVVLPHPIPLLTRVVPGENRRPQER
jgi:hypothetical protein